MTIKFTNFRLREYGFSVTATDGTDEVRAIYEGRLGYGWRWTVRRGDGRWAFMDAVAAAAKARWPEQFANPKRAKHPFPLLPLGRE